MFKRRGWYAFQDGNKVSSFYVVNRQGYDTLINATQNIRNPGSRILYVGQKPSQIKRQFPNASIYVPKDARQNPRWYGIRPSAKHHGETESAFSANTDFTSNARRRQAKVDWDKAFANRIQPSNQPINTASGGLTPPPGGRQYGPAMTGMPAIHQGYRGYVVPRGAHPTYSGGHFYGTY